MIAKGSIVATRCRGDTEYVSTYVHTIAIVDRVDGRKLYCKYAIASVDGGEYVKVRELFRQYEGEYIEDVRLCSPSEFDDILDSGIVPRKMFKNVGSAPE